MSEYQKKLISNVTDLCLHCCSALGAFCLPEEHRHTEWSKKVDIHPYCFSGVHFFGPPCTFTLVN